MKFKSLPSLLLYLLTVDAQRCMEDKRRGAADQLNCRDLNSSSQLLGWIRPIYKTVVINNEKTQHFSFSSKVPSMSFDSVINLDISKVGLVTFGNGLSDFKSLKFLNISGLHIENFPYKYLYPDNLIEDLDATDNHLKYSTAKIIQTLPKLKTAYLSKNELKSFEGEVFNETKHLKYLYLNDNEYDTITRRYFAGLTNLLGLYICSNYISSLEPSCFDGLSNLEILDLSSNQLESFEPESLFGLRSLKSLNMSNNDMKILLPNQFKNSPYIESLDVSMNRLDRLSLKSLVDLPLLKNLNLKDNSLTSLEESDLGNCGSLETIDLSMNDIRGIPKNIFGSNLQSNLRHIFLDFNGIKSIHYSAFSNLPNLEYLHLQYNALSTLDPRLFLGNKLKTLVLSHNVIRYLPFELFEALTFIRDLLIDHNWLSYFPNITNEMPLLNTISIEGNPWQCPCFDLLIETLNERNINYIKSNEYFLGESPLCIFTSANYCASKNIKPDRDYLLHKYYEVFNNKER